MAFTKRDFFKINNYLAQSTKPNLGLWYFESIYQFYSLKNNSILSEAIIELSEKVAKVFYFYREFST
jgi:hypothetical protein